MNKKIPFAIIIVGAAVLYPLQRRIETIDTNEGAGPEALYLKSGERLRKASMGFDGLLADVYWMRTVQYFGRKVVDAGGPGVDTSKVPMDLLAPLLRIVVGLDPHHIPAYRFGAIFLSDHDMGAAIDLLQNGVEKNPTQWRLYQDLGYIYWHQGRFDKAAEIYDAGSAIPGAAWWMRDLAGLMRLRGGSRESARQLYTRYLESDDLNIRNEATLRLKQIESEDRLDFINRAIQLYRTRSGQCPRDLRQLAGAFRSFPVPLREDSSPIDPDGFPYVLDQQNCRAQLAEGSTIVR